MPTRRIITALLLALLATLSSAWLAPAALLNLLPFHWQLFDGPSHGANYSVLWSTTPIRTLTFTEGTDPLWGLNAPRAAKPPYWFTPPTAPSPALREETEAAGFPFRAFSCTTTYSVASRAGPYTLQNIRGGLQLREHAERFRVLPLAPIWLGLLADLAIWSLASFLALTTIHHLRARRAARFKGLCPHCRYDRTGLPPTTKCPECGRPQS